MNVNVTIAAVKDVIEIKPNVAGSTHAPGLVVVFDGRQCGYHLPRLGATVELLRPDGSTLEAKVGEIKEHGEGRSFFFAGLTREDGPIGTILTWNVRISSTNAYEPQIAM